MGTSFLALARKYRPNKLQDLIGQEVFVSTIKNSIDSDRTSHAYLLSGIRGVGKTTAARILAHLFNGKTETKDNNPMDLYEVDSARYTGVNEMRELLDGIKYRPSSWKYKVYILDEVHMLSNSAVSSLLKNLEEPPEYVKFIFCTTEPRKIPATIISRCQRFDLKRVSFNLLAEHLQNIAKKEGSQLEITAANLIAKAADGSVRDGLSILDKSLSSGEQKITEKYVQDLLGLVDRTKIYSLFKNLMNGKPKESLDIFNELYDSGAEPGTIIQDLLDLVHWLTRVHVTPEVVNEPGTSEIDKNMGEELAKELNMGELSKTWQILLKGYQEVQSHDMPNIIAEMVLVRLVYAADLPTTDEVVKDLLKKNHDMQTHSDRGKVQENNVDDTLKEEYRKTKETPTKNIKTDTVMEMKNVENLVKDPEVKPQDNKTTMEKKQESMALSCFKDVADLFLKKKEILLFNNLFSHVRLVNFQKGKIELNPMEDLPKDFSNKISSLLKDWTGDRWILFFSQEKGEMTLEEQSEREKKDTIKQLMQDKRVKEILQTFPGSAIGDIIEEEEKDE